MRSVARSAYGLLGRQLLIGTGRLRLEDSRQACRAGLQRVGVRADQPDGSGQTNLTNHVDFDGNPAWSPDGRRIAFTSLRHISSREAYHEIFVMNRDGSGRANLTSTPAGEGQPAWSPDGRMVAFVSDREGNDEVYVMNADGSGQTRRTTNTVADGEPAWSPRP